MCSINEKKEIICNNINEIWNEILILILIMCNESNEILMAYLMKIMWKVVIVILVLMWK